MTTVQLPPALGAVDLDPTWLRVTVDLAAGRVTLTGDLERDSGHHLVDAVTALAATRHDRWLVDGAGVTFCDAGGVRALASADALARGLGRRLVVRRSSRCLRRLLVLTGLDVLEFRSGTWN